MKSPLSQLLIIEENPHIVTVLTQTLRADYQITVATNSRDAVRMLIQGRKFDCVITELDLPFFDGLEIIKLVRMSKLMGRTPILVLSEAYDSDTRIACLEAGADGHIAKPFNPLEVKVKLHSITLRSGMSHERVEAPLVTAHSSLLKRFWSPGSLNL